MPETFGTRALRLGLGLASLGCGAVALARAVGVVGPLAPWSEGLGAVPFGEPLGNVLGAALVAIGMLLLARRAVSSAAGALAAFLVGSLVLSPPGMLGAIQDLGLLGGALALVALPAPLAARLPRRLAACFPVVASHQAAAAPTSSQALLLRLGLALTFLLAGWEKFVNTAWYADLLAATGGLAAWPVLGGWTTTGLLLWLGTIELFLCGLIVYGPPVRLASATAVLLIALGILALHTPSLLVAKAIGLLGAALAAYAWATGVTVLENAQIGWLRAAGRQEPADGPPAAREGL
jgi:uncharacterized membrane protein YphA (DoxX/SURF4 family)